MIYFMFLSFVTLATAASVPELPIVSQNSSNLQGFGTVFLQHSQHFMNFTFSFGAGENTPKVSVSSTDMEIDSSSPTTSSSKNITTRDIKNHLTSFHPSIPESTRPKNLRNDYNYTERIGAHKFHNHNVTFNEARKICIAEGGHLAIINSNAEAQILQNIFKEQDKHNSEQAYIGIYRIHEANDWVTMLGESIATAGYDKWAKDQPNNVNGNQNCGTVYKMGGLNDVHCEILSPFFCEIDV